MNLLRLLGLVALLTSVSACADGYVPPPPGGGTGATGGTAASGGTGAAGGAAGNGGNGGSAGTTGNGGAGGMSGAGGMGGAGGFVGGDCVNETDLEVIRTTRPNYRMHAAVCGTQCPRVTRDAFLNCVDVCIRNRAPGLTSSCTNCYGERAWCAGAACNTWCANQTINACTTECTSDSARCPGYDACLSNLDDCAGRDSLDCFDDT